MKKISIIMPCYNDAETVVAALQSVEAQTSDAWEMIIVNDGSTDGSLEIIQDFVEGSGFAKRYKVLAQANQDQLVAIQNGAKHAHGDYIYVLHSDDLLYDEKSLERFLETEAKHPGYDAYTGSRLEVNVKSQATREVKTRPILPEQQALALTYLWLGRNIYMDVAFFERQAFEQHISETYLSQNMPYWMRFSDDGAAHALRIYNMSFPLLRYHIHDENYAKSKLGAANVLSGELRCLLKLASGMHIPAYRLQFTLYRLLNKLKKDFAYRPFYKSVRQNPLTPILKLVFEKASDPELSGMAPFATILHFFSLRDTGKNADIANIPPLSAAFKAPRCNQMRSYNRACIEGRLNKEHLSVLEILAQGAEVLTCLAADADEIRHYLLYLGLDQYVRVEVLSD